jgi:hydroxyacylglutathione hydrolase
MKCVIVPVTPFQQNCSVFWDETTGIGAVVDPGGDIDLILAAIAQHKVRVEKLLITHGHLDHAGATAELAARLGVPVEGPQEEDQFWIDGIEDSAARYGFPGAKGFTPDRWLHHGDKVTVGGMELDVIHCPGHTPGHVTFVHQPSKLAFVGDVLFQGSIGRTDFPRGDHAALISSIRERLFPLGDDITFVPGHGPTSTFGRERKTNPFVHD